MKLARMVESTSTRELDPLTDSLSSVIRWRYCDYAAILRAEFVLLAGLAEDQQERPNPPWH